MYITEMLKQFDYNPRQSILVCDDHCCNLAADNAINKGDELRALQVQSTADFLDPLVYWQPLCCTKRLKHRSLIGEIRLLCVAGYPHIDDCAALNTPAPHMKHLRQMIIRVHPAKGLRAFNSYDHLIKGVGD